MNLVADIGSQRIGDWHFYPASGELRRGQEIRRLEPRAVRTLELLCASRGGVVTHEALIQNVWNGRTLSENSVAVVVGQLRKALDDDARDPRLIETIPKRGYRLVAETPRQARPQWRRPGLAALVIALLIVAALIGLRERMTARPEVAMTDIANRTGEARYDPLVRASTELMLAELSKRGYEIERGGRGRMTIAGKLVMWNHAPYLGLSATDANGVVRWSAMMKGTADVVPANLRKALDDFQQRVPR